MDMVGVFEAKTRLSELLDRVATGQEVVITRHGVPVARLIPATTPHSEQVVQAATELRKLQAETKLNPVGRERLTIRDLIGDGRK